MNARTAVGVAIGLMAGAAFFPAGGLSQPATRAGLGWSANHQPPWLVVRGRPVTLGYGFHGSSAFPRTGTLYIRNSLQRTYARVPLVKSSDLLVAHVPAHLAEGTKLLYYASLRDPASGRTLMIPAAGRRSPQRVWVVNRPVTVRLGVHRFGHLRAPDDVIARAGPKDVGFECGHPSACPDAEPPPGDGCGCTDVLPQGPSSFDIGKDGSTWLLDELNNRLLVWRSRRPAAPARSIKLPANQGVSDFALGPGGRIYLFATNLGSGHRSLWALSPSGRVQWKAPIGNGFLRIGPDGVPYAVGAYEDDPSAWTPLTTATGRPLSLAAQRRGTTPFQPLPGGLRLVTVWLSSHELRFALVNRADEVTQAWQVTSRTEVGSGFRATPALVGGDLVVPLDFSRQLNGASLWEHVLVRFGASARSQQLALDARAIWGDPDTYTAPLRVGPDGRVYQLRTNPTTGVSVARYRLARAS